MAVETAIISTGKTQAISSDREIRELKCLYVQTAATADDTDTFTVDLSVFGGTTLLAVDGFIQTTAGSVIVAEADTTSVSGTTVTVTIGGSTDDKVRGVKIYFE